MNQPKESVLVIGGGTMGVGIAAAFAARGWPVIMVEADSRRHPDLPDRIRQAAGEVVAELPAELPLIIHTRLSEVHWASVGLVIESIYEELAAKQAVFRQLEEYAPPAIPLCSNSSSFPISEITRGLGTQARMLGLHFFMPAQIVPAVEVVCSEHSSPEVVQQVTDLMWAVGKRPILVKKDIPGFLANRLQHALMREAIALVAEGFASAEDVDAAVQYGFGFRYLAAGPLKQKDLAGIDIHHLAAQTMYPHLNADTEPSPYMEQLVKDGKIGIKSGTLQGFYDWTPEQAEQAKKRYHSALRKALEIMSGEGS